MAINLSSKLLKFHEIVSFFQDTIISSKILNMHLKLYLRLFLNRCWRKKHQNTTEYSNNMACLKKFKLRFIISFYLTCIYLNDKDQLFVSCSFVSLYTNSISTLIRPMTNPNASKKEIWNYLMGFYTMEFIF